MSSWASSPEWTRDALCQEYDRALFFPVRGETGARARAICERCAVKGECLAYAMSILEVEGCIYGVWGGTSERDRKAMLKRSVNVGVA